MLQGRALAAATVARVLAASRARLGFAVVYHRVDRDGDDPARAIVPAFPLERFEQDLLHLAAHYRPVLASELSDAILTRRRGGRLPVAVTFDDDLDSHARVAAPALVRLGVPGTFFLSGSADQPWWWDDLQRAVDGRHLRSGDLGPTIGPTLEPALAREPWALHRVARDIAALPAEQRRETARTLSAAVAALPPTARLAATDVRSLVASGFEIGFHTLRHEPLPGLDDEALGAALRDGRAELEAVTGRPLRTIAYPHGQADGRVAAAAAAAGFEAGYTTTAAAIGAAHDRLRLGRIPPAHVSLGHFATAAARALLRARAG